MFKRFSISEIEQDIVNLGIQKDGIVFVNADISRIGFIVEDPAGGFLKALQTVIGPSGTVIAPAFTYSDWFFRLNKDFVFDENAPILSGAFSKSVKSNPHSYRSNHPVCSFVAVGKHAKEILNDHDFSKSSYHPFKRIIEMDGKCLSVGCSFTNPGFTVLHWSQFEFGQATKSFFKGKAGVFYREGNDVKKFKRLDIGGHAGGILNLFPIYEQKGILKLGMIGSGCSILASARELHETNLQELQKNPKIMLCSDRNCFSCRTSWTYNKLDIPGYWLRFAVRRIKSALVKKRTK